MVGSLFIAEERDEVTIAWREHSCRYPPATAGASRGYVIGGAAGRDGRQLSDSELDAWVDQFADPEHGVEGLPPARRRAGRPSLSGTPNHSPRITVRLDPDERRDVKALAKASGSTQAELLSKAVSEYLSTHRTAAADPQNLAH